MSHIISYRSSLRTTRSRTGIICGCILFAVLSSFSPLIGQVTLYNEGFETDGEGVRYTSNTYSYCPTDPDYFFRTNTNPVVPPGGCVSGFGSALTGLQGSFFWAGEDIMSNQAPYPGNHAPGNVTSSAINIAGYNTLTFSFYLATASNNNVRWETADSINIQASIDGGPFRTVGRFMGNNPAGGRLTIDQNLNGVIDGSEVTFCDVANFTQYTFSIPGTGSTMRIRVDCDQFGGTEESAFDELRVTGISAGCSNPVITTQPNNTTACSGGNTSFTISSTGATSYQWQVNTGSGFVNLTNVAPYSGTATQTLTITGATVGMNGYLYRCIATQLSCNTTSGSASLSISNPILTVNSQLNVNCFGGNSGAATVSPANGGIAPYSYNWTPGNPTGDGTISVSGLIAGTWTCTATDNIGCTAAATFNITSPTAIVVTPSAQTNISCSGGSNGAASINTPTGGAGGYTYNWTPGNPTGDGTASVTGLTAGTWTCTVTDANSCVATQTFNITAPSAIVVTPASQTNISCFGGSNGAAQINTPTGGAGGYTYNWTPGNPTGDGTTSVTGLVAGTWTCTVTDANSCVATQTFNITAPSALVVTPASQTNISCNGGSNGAASINTPTGGAGGYTYNWTPGNPTGDGTTSITGLVAGTWTCTVTDANSCVATQTFNITAPSAIVVTPASQTNISCNGGSNGAASINAPTGGAGGYTYSWTPGNPTGDGTVSVTGLTAGTWTCTVTDANSCVATQTFNVTAPSVINASISSTPTSCSANTGTATVSSVTGGAGSYTYLWSPSGGTAATAASLAAGTYTCTITDANSCQITRTVSVATASGPTLTAASQTNIACNGGATGAASVNAATGGTSPYTYNWTPGNPTGDGTVSVTGLTAGTWTCTVTDAGGCTATVTFNITQPATPVSGGISITNVICFGGSTGAINLIPSGGTGSYTYQWLPSGPTTEDRTGITAGTYSVQITDANGCTGTVTATITQPPAIVISATQTNVSCNGGNNGAAGASVSGGTPGYSYSWAPSGGTGPVASGLSAGVYTVTVTDANSCTNTQTFNITQPTALVASAVSQTNISCNGGSNGAASVTVSGGTTAYSYNWTPGNPAGDGTASVTGLTAGTWTCTVTDANSCVTTQTFNITAPSALTATSSATPISCNGGNATVTVVGAGGTAPYTGTGTFTVTAGTYSYTVTDANGCTVTTSITITEPTALTAAATASSILCNGGNSTITVVGAGGTAPYTGEGSFTVTAGTHSYTVADANGCTVTTSITLTEPTALTAAATASSILCNGGNSTVTVVGAGGTAPYTGEGSFTVTAGTHSYTVTDANGCTVTTSITVTEPTALTAAATATSILCNGGNATVTVVGAGGTSPYTGEGSFTVTAGTHSFTVTDANGCTVTTSITITEPTALTATTSANAILCAGGTANITVLGSGGTAPYAGEGTFTVTAGTYSYTITDTNGCTVTTSVTITEPTVLSLTINSFSNPTMCGGSDGTIDININGGTPGYSYLWSNSATTQDVSGLSAGIYSCVVLDSNSCGTQVIVTLSDPNASAVTLTLPIDTVCVNDGAFVLGGESPIGGTFSGPGVTAGSFDPTAAGVGMHMISYTFTDSSGCTGSTTDSIYVDVCTDAQSPVSGLVSQISIFPNPNDGTFTLQTTSVADVMIFDAQGKLVYTQKVQANVATQMNIVESGMYMITVTNANGERTSQRVIVTK